jgi:signal transduction histidine kinase
VILSAIALKLPEHDVIAISFIDIGEISAVQKQLRHSNLRLAKAMRLLESQRDKIIHSEKMASIGQLAAGVAHEINNPIGYVTSNLATISEYTEFMSTLINLYRQMVELSPGDPARTALEAQLAAVMLEEDLEYVLADLDAILRESVEGTARVAAIVQNLKSFARDDSQQKLPHDLNEGVEAMIRMVWNELKYSCTVEKDLGQLPPVHCHAGQINQVIMNILVNASHAIGPGGGVISISTGADDHEAVVTITDTGCGMTPETASHIFDPFFTTKDIGVGTGLGLSISHGIVTDHGGRIEVASTPGKGSTFRICLPLAPSDAELLIG